MIFIDDPAIHRQRASLSPLVFYSNFFYKVLVGMLVYTPVLV